MRKAIVPNPTTETTKVHKTRNSNWEEGVADRLELFASKEDAYILEEFYLNERIPERTFYDGVARNEKLRQAHDYALMRLGVNREKLALKGREGLNTANVAMLPVYLNRWAKHKAHSEAREDKKMGDTENQTKIVVIEKFKDEIE